MRTMNPEDGLIPGRGRNSIGGWLGVFLLLMAMVGTTCRLYNLERKLDPEYADFLSKVRYIITGEERKVFLQATDSQKNRLIEEFWQRRDQLPETPVNEYRQEYEARVERAGQLFRGEGRQGWLTDRGRIYILFGPPQERLTYPMDVSGFCREVWYYGDFPVLFIDEHCSGQFSLTAINLEHLQEINIAQGYFQKPAVESRAASSYEIKVDKIRSTDSLYEARVFLMIPYDKIWFSFKENRLEAVFEVRLELKTGSDEIVWEAGKTFEVATDNRELKSLKEAIYKMEVPLVLDGGLDVLREAQLTLFVAVKNVSQGEEFRTTLEFRLES